MCWACLRSDHLDLPTQGSSIRYVTDATALLATNDYPQATWAAPLPGGRGPVIVTYSFLDNAELPPESATAYPVTDVFTYNQTQRANFRAALAEFTRAAGIVFVETQGPAMIEAYGVDGSGYGGWADYAWSGEAFTGTSRLIIDDDGNLNRGTYGFTTALHEIGHAVGLMHPFEGDIRLVDRLDTTDYTVMSYTDVGNATRLGPLDVDALRMLYGGPINTTGWQMRVEGGVFVGRGSARGDAMTGPGMDSRLAGLDGRDTLTGREDRDTLLGGFGDDLLRGGYNGDRLWGEGGRDVLAGGQGGDLLAGGGGDDRLDGGTGRDSLGGGDGRDTLAGGSDDDEISGGAGYDRLSGGSGGDRLYAGADGGLLSGDTGSDTLYGGSGGTTQMYGGDGRDTITAGAGRAQLWGGTGDDTFRGGASADVMHGADGADTLTAGAGDQAYGGAGTDTVFLATGAVAAGGAARDRFIFAEGATARIRDFAVGEDVVILDGPGAPGGLHSLTFLAQAGGTLARVVIDAGGPVTSIFLAGVARADIDADSFLAW